MHQVQLSKHKNNNYWCNGITLYITGADLKGADALENSLAVPQILNIVTYNDTAIPLVVIYPKELETRPQRSMYTNTHIAALFKLKKKRIRLKKK